MATQQSTVKWFDAKKGYGFINHPDGGDDVFVHYTQIDSDKEFKTLRTGQTVEFELNDGPKGLHAVNVAALADASEGAQELSSEDIGSGVTRPVAGDEEPARPDFSLPSSDL